MSLDDWDRVIRVGRASRLLATLRQRLDAAGALDAVPGPVRNHLDSEAAAARYRKQLVLRDLHQLESVLEPVAAPIVLLKGAAYIVQNLRFADGRTVSDVDLLVPRDRLAEVETRLREAGLDTRRGGPVRRALLPRVESRSAAHALPGKRARARPAPRDPAADLARDGRSGAALRRIAPGPGLGVPGPRAGGSGPARMRARIRGFGPRGPSARHRRSRRIVAGVRGPGRVVGPALRPRDRRSASGAPSGTACATRRCWSRRRSPRRCGGRLDAQAPNAVVRRLIDWLVANVTPPAPLSTSDRRLDSVLPALLALIRYFWIRMPLPILVRHAAVKGARRIFPRTASAS